MNIQKKLDKTTEGYWAKFVVSTDGLGRLKGLKDDRCRLLNTYFGSFGFGGINDAWRKISKKNALDCLSHVISRSISYGNIIVQHNEATYIASEFLNGFADDAKIYTNLSPFSWEPKFELRPSWHAAWNHEDYTDEDGRGYLSCIAVIVFDECKIGIFAKLESD